MHVLSGGTLPDNRRGSYAVASPLPDGPLHEHQARQLGTASVAEAATSAIVEPATHRLTRSPRCDERQAAASDGADGWLPAAACTGGDAGGDADGDAGGGVGGGDGGVHSESLAAAAATSDRRVRPFDYRVECGAARNISSQSDELSSTCKSPQKKWTHERAPRMSAIQFKDKAGAFIARRVRDARRI